MELYSEKMEALIKAAFADGELTDKERQVLMRKAAEEGIDPDEFEMVLDARVTELEKVKPKTKIVQKSSPRKCPACGALVPALAVKCPECGYEFSGVASSSSSQKLLAAQIAEITREAAKQKKEIIASGKYSKQKDEFEIFSEQERVIHDVEDASQKQIDSLVDSFPIPNAKEDLFDLILYLKSQRFTVKYEECLKRAELLFPNDPHFIQLQEKAKLEAKAEKKSERRIVFFFIAFFVGIFAFIILLKLLEKWLGIDLSFLGI